jgi:hypothetical protein
MKPESQTQANFAVIRSVKLLVRAKRVRGRRFLFRCSSRANLSRGRVQDRPGDATAWADLGQTSAHFGLHLWAAGESQKAIPLLNEAKGAFVKALEFDSDTIFPIQHAAWFLSFNPIADPADRGLALELAHSLNTRLNLDDGNRREFASGLRALFTLGLAEYRAGNLQADEAAVLRSMALRQGGDAYEMFLRAMILARKRGPASRKWFAQADEWMRRRRHGDFELHLLRKEAAQLLPAR